MKTSAGYAERHEHTMDVLAGDGETSEGWTTHPALHLKGYTFNRKMTVAQRIAEVEQGVPYSAFQRLSERLGVSEERLRRVLGFSAATLHRRKHAGRFTLEESNRLYWLRSLLDTADEVLEDPEETRVLMTTGNLALSGAVPLDYARTAPGLEAVRRLLYRLDYGVVV